MVEVKLHDVLAVENVDGVNPAWWMCQRHTYAWVAARAARMQILREVGSVEQRHFEPNSSYLASKAADEQVKDILREHP